MEGTVTISINEFEEIRDKAKQFKKLNRDMQREMYMHYNDETDEWTLFVKKDGLSKILKEHNPESFDVDPRDITEVVWQ